MMLPRRQRWHRFDHWMPPPHRHRRVAHVPPTVLDVSVNDEEQRCRTHAVGQRRTRQRAPRSHTHKFSSLIEMCLARLAVCDAVLWPLRWLARVRHSLEPVGLAGPFITVLARMLSLFNASRSAGLCSNVRDRYAAMRQRDLQCAQARGTCVGPPADRWWTWPAPSCA